MPALSLFLVPLFIALGCSQMLLEVGASFSPDPIAFGSFLKKLFLLGDLLGSSSSNLWSSSSGFDASAVYVVVFIFYSGTL
jgi:hypothetical protein